ncbi:MAG: hypothetical protein F4X11_11195 [Acidobacteria bacterium]|nr:hypothetical protein [Acidobacteriota bacterium]
MFPTRDLSLRLILAAALALQSASAAAQGGRAAALRQEASELLGGALETVAGMLPGDAPDPALLDAVDTAFDVRQRLGNAVFAVPVAGNIGYVLRARVFHDLTIMFPPAWRIAQVFPGDATRWRVTQLSSLVVVQPGEAQARTNLTVVFANGELLQVDLQEITGVWGVERTGRAYIGPESWLVRRIFAMMPADVEARMTGLIVSGELPVGALLADPVEAIRRHGAFDALPPPPDMAGFAPPRRERAAAGGPAAPVGPDPAGAAAPAARPPEAARGQTGSPDPDADEAAAEDAGAASPVAPAPVVPGFDDPAPAPGPEPEAIEPGVLPPGDGVGPVIRPPSPAAALGDGPAGPAPARIRYVSLVPSRAALAAGRPEARAQGARPPAADVPPLDAQFVSGDEIQALESELAAAERARDYARRSAGDRLAEAALGIEAGLAELRADYPSRVQFSLMTDPEMPPYTGPFWHLGGWHDGDYTYWRLLAPDPVFVDAETGRTLRAEGLDRFLYRLDGVVERGAIVVDGPNGRPRHLYWRRRRELEGP